MICGSHSTDYVEYYIPGYNATESQLMSQKNIFRVEE
jgi:hypothetical protein